MKQLKANGEVKFAFAMIEQEKMIGSMVIYEYDNQEELEESLKKEPYIQQGVWQDVSIQTVQIPPLFEYIPQKHR
jgi:uncharacterized protein YciI